jgi:hypothetical protein
MNAFEGQQALFIRELNSGLMSQISNINLLKMGIMLFPSYFKHSWLIYFCNSLWNNFQHNNQDHT